MYIVMYMFVEYQLQHAVHKQSKYCFIAREFRIHKFATCIFHNFAIVRYYIRKQLFILKR